MILANSGPRSRQEYLDRACRSTPCSSSSAASSGCAPGPAAQSASSLAGSIRRSSPSISSAASWRRKSGFITGTAGVPPKSPRAVHTATSWLKLSSHQARSRSRRHSRTKTISWYRAADGSCLPSALAAPGKVRRRLARQHGSHSGRFPASGGPSGGAGVAAARGRAFGAGGPSGPGGSSGASGLSGAGGLSRPGVTGGAGDGTKPARRRPASSPQELRQAGHDLGPRRPVVRRGEPEQLPELKPALAVLAGHALLVDRGVLLRRDAQVLQRDIEAHRVAP